MNEKEMLTALSLDELAALVGKGAPDAGAAEDTDARPLSGRTPRPDKENLPLSYAQERLWFMNRLSPGKTFANLPFCLEITGNLDVDAFCRAWLDVAGRHEPLTSIFPITDEGKPCLRFIPVDLCALETEDISSLNPEQQEEYALRAMARESDSGFDLTKGPLMRGRLLCHGQGVFTFIYNFHHSVFDGWSVSIFIDELFWAYEARHAGREPDFPALPATYSDYALWHREQMRSPAASENLRWWKAHLDGVEDLELPADFPRKSEQSFAGETIQFAVPERVRKQAEIFALANGSTPFMFWLSVFALVLGRYAGQNAFAVGSSIAGRDHPATESLIGFFVNNLVIKADFSPSMTVRDYFAAMRESILLSFEHGNLPFQLIAESMGRNLDLSRNPICQATLTYQNFYPPGKLPQGLSLRSRLVPLRASHMDLDLLLAPEDTGLTGFLFYATDLFKAKTAERMVHSFTELAGSITEYADVPLTVLFRLETVFPGYPERGASLLSTPAEAHLITSPWNLFKKQANLKPDAPALVLSDDFPGEPDATSQRDGQTRIISYARLNALAESMAGCLARSGLGKGSVTALLMLSGVELITAILAVWRQGGTWVPLDPNHPPSRLYEVLRSSGASRLICLPQHLDTLDLQGNGLGHITAHVITPWQLVGEEKAAPPPAGMDADDTICILHTSGSTGTPKGIPITVKGLSHRVAWMQTRYPGQPGDLTCQKTSPLFGDYIAETFGSLMDGIPVLLLGHDSSLDVGRLMEKMEQYGVTQIGLVTSLLAAMHRISSGLTGRLPTLRRIISSGEGMSVELADATLRAIPGVRIINLYGAMETLDMSCFEHSEKTLGTLPPTGNLPAGSPLPGVSIALADANLIPVPLGSPGIIHAAGPGLMPGYLFGGSNDAFSLMRLRDTPERWFRVGDAGLVDAEGRLVYLGRKDQQIKVRGVRVEPQEVRRHILAFGGVKDAFVTAWSSPRENTRLIAFVVPEQWSGSETDGWEQTPNLRAFLMERLPAVMLPDFVMPVAAWPRTPSGKINAPRLLEMFSSFAGREVPVPAFDEHSAEGALYQLWTQVIGVGGIHVRVNFFEAGGNSLLLVDLHEKIQREFSLSFPLTVLFQNPTIESQAAYLRKQGAGSSRLTADSHADQAIRRREPFISSRLRARGMQPANTTEQ